MKKFQYDQLVLYFILGAALLAVMYPFILPMILGCGMALVVEPLVIKVNERVKNYNLSVRIVLVIILGIILLPVGLLIASGIEAIVSYSHTSDFVNLKIQYDTLVQTLFQKVSPWLANLGLSVEKLREPLLTIAQKLGTFLLVILQRLAQQAPKILLDTFVIIFSGYFTLAYKEDVSKWLTKNPFINAATNSRLVKNLHDISYSVILAAMVAGILQMLIMLIASLVAGNDQWLLVAVLTFFFSFVPVVGTSPITGTLIVYALVSENYFALIVYLCAIAGLFLVDNILKPYLIGNKAKMNPILAFLSALGGLNLLGFYGLFFGPILLGVALSMLKEAWEPPVEPESLDK